MKNKTVTIPEEYYNILKKEAEKQTRSISNMVVVLIKEHIK
jgi:predicted CopG family antitoxin